MRCTRMSKLLLDNINLALQLVAVGALLAYVITQFFKAFVVFFLLLFEFGKLRF